MDYLLRMSYWEVLAIIFALIIALLVSVVGSAWVYCDARRLGRSALAGFLWGFGVLIFWPVFLFLWLITRSDKTEEETAGVWTPQGERAPSWEEEEEPEVGMTAWGCFGYSALLALLLAFAVFCGAWLVSVQRGVDLGTAIFGSPEEATPQQAVQSGGKRSLNGAYPRAKSSLGR